MNFDLVLSVSRTESETSFTVFNLLSFFVGGSEQGSGFSTAVSSAGPALSAPNQSSASSDKYAALAELDSVFSSTATSSNAYTATSNASRYGPTACSNSTQELEICSYLNREAVHEFRGATETASLGLDNGSAEG